MSDTNKKINKGGLGVLALSAIVISSMIGGGVYNLPQNMASVAGAGAVIIAWLITGIGIYFIANSFRVLSVVKPDLKAGIYMYSREGFGPYMGFTIGWGYWLCQIFGNVGYAVITMDALNYFFPPYFEGGNNLYSIIGGSIIIWVFNFLVLKGVKQATIVNIIGTSANFIALTLFAIILIFMFNIDKFSFDFWGHMVGGGEKDLGSIPDQVKATMLVTLWAFIGIEGAVVMSGKAKSQQDVSRATIIGFIGCLTIYALLSLLPFGFMTQAEIGAAAPPSTAAVLERAVGPWGSWLMNAGMLIAVLSSWLAWTMIASAIPHAAGENGTFPKVFAKTNKNEAPCVSLWVTSIIMQITMILVYFADDAWNTMLSITGVMVLPAYLTSTAYLWKLCEDGEYPTTGVSVKRSTSLLSGILGSVFAVWLLYSAGASYLLMAVCFLAIGIPVFIWARMEAKDGKPIFTCGEKILAGAIIAIAIAAIVFFCQGIIKV